MIFQFSLNHFFFAYSFLNIPEYYSFVKIKYTSSNFNMIRLLILAQLFLLPTTYSHQYSSIIGVDQDVLNKFWQYASKQQLTTLGINERIPKIAAFFIGTPYKSNTLNVTLKELPVINLHELDCVTFVENVLALAFLEEYNNNAIPQFIANIIKLRYRNGEIIDYTSRLHYSSDWLYEMQKQHFLTDITQFAGGLPYSRTINFMSANYTRYPQLVHDTTLLKKIKDIETTIKGRTYYYIPKGQIGKACNKIKNGDIILITTNIKGLDTSHLGFAWKKDGKTFLLHASSSGKKVMISQLPLQEYMQGISTQTGIMVGRAPKVPPSESGK